MSPYSALTFMLNDSSVSKLISFPSLFDFLISRIPQGDDFISILNLIF